MVQLNSLNCHFVEGGVYPQPFNNVMTQMSFLLILVGCFEALLIRASESQSFSIKIALKLLMRKVSIEFRTSDGEASQSKSVVNRAFIVGFKQTHEN